MSPPRTWRRQARPHYVYGLAGRLLAESDRSGNTLTEYAWLDDMPLAVVANVHTSPNLYFVHVDHLNRPIMMTNSVKSLVWRADYNPFGDAYSIGGLATNNLRFPGQYFLIEDGLHYNWYRHYDPTIGRYIQPDPLGFISGTSLYNYAMSGPLEFIDPFGLWAGGIGGYVGVSVGGVTVGVGIGIVSDGNGNFGWYDYTNYGASTGRGFFVGVNPFFSKNARTICDLNGPFYNIGGATSIDGVAGSVDYFWGNSPNGPVSGTSTLFGGGVGSAVSSTTSVTSVHVLGSIP